MPELKEILHYQFLGNSINRYLIALGLAVSIIIIFEFLQKIVIYRLRKITEKSKTSLDNLVVNMLADIGWPFYSSLALYVASLYLNLPKLASDILLYIFIIAATFQGVKILQEVVEHIAAKAATKDRNSKQVIKTLSTIIKVVIWIIAGLLILSNLGYDISSLVAGLGIGGIAVALAVQNILGDIFSSFSIYLDKPFEVDDFIVVKDYMGTVKKIGIKTTRIQSLQGEELVVPNKELLGSIIQNYKRMEKRRVAFMVGVTYGTKNTSLREIPKLTRNIFEKIKEADLDRVHFKEFGNSSLNFEIVYYVNSQDYVTYMEVQERVNLLLKGAFEKEGIEFAFPTQTVFVRKD